MADRVGYPLGGAYLPVSAEVLALAGAYTGEPMATVVGLDPTTGTEFWRALTSGEKAVATPALVGGQVFVVTAGALYPEPAAVHALDAASGAALWRAVTPYVSIAAPAVLAGGDLATRPATGGVLALG